MNEILRIVLGWLIPFVLGAAVGAAALWLAGFAALRDGVQHLLRAEIINQNEKWVERGYCPVYAKQALSRGYKAYHKLGGNDVATGLYEETMALPERPTERGAANEAEKNR